jgi:hypothetical protein
LYSSINLLTGLGCQHYGGRTTGEECSTIKEPLVIEEISAIGASQSTTLSISSASTKFSTFTLNFSLSIRLSID